MKAMFMDTNSTNRIGYFSNIPQYSRQQSADQLNRSTVGMAGREKTISSFEQGSVPQKLFSWPGSQLDPETSDRNLFPRDMAWYPRCNHSIVFGINSRAA